jgi:hypothetical protein
MRKTSTGYEYGTCLVLFECRCSGDNDNNDNNTRNNTTIHQLLQKIIWRYGEMERAIGRPMVLVRSRLDGYCASGGDTRSGGGARTMTTMAA